MSDSQQQGVPAVGFLVVAFLDEWAADQALDEMKKAKAQGKFYFEDAAVIRQDAQGKVHYHETGEMGRGKGAGIGALVGGIVGVLGGPVGVALGAGVGAAVGAATSGDKGFRNESLGTVGVALKPGTSAIAAITSHDFLRAVQKQVPIDQIRAAVNDLAAELAARLEEKKNVAVGLLLTEAGIAVREIAANEESTEIVAAVITDEAVVAGAAVATADGIAYQIVGSSKEGTAAEVGVITDQGAVIVDAVALAEAPAIEAESAAPAADAAAEPAAPAAEEAKA